MQTRLDFPPRERYASLEVIEATLDGHRPVSVATVQAHIANHKCDLRTDDASDRHAGLPCTQRDDVPVGRLHDRRHWHDRWASCMAVLFHAATVRVGSHHVCCTHRGERMCRDSPPLSLPPVATTDRRWLLFVAPPFDRRVQNFFLCVPRLYPGSFQRLLLHQKMGSGTQLTLGVVGRRGGFNEPLRRVRRMVRKVGTVAATVGVDQHPDTT